MVHEIVVILFYNLLSLNFYSRNFLLEKKIYPGIWSIFLSSLYLWCPQKLKTRRHGFVFPKTAFLTNINIYINKYYSVKIYLFPNFRLPINQQSTTDFARQKHTRQKMFKKSAKTKEPVIQYQATYSCSLLLFGCDVIVVDALEVTKQIYNFWEYALF